MGASLVKANAANSLSILMPSRWACSSRNEPVPAAQAWFIVKSTTTPFSSDMYLLSWPPISNIVSTFGLTIAAPIAWAVISFMTISAPIKSPVRYLPEPVVAAPNIFTLPTTFLPTISMPWRTASRGLPAVIKYALAKMRFCSSITATFVLSEPTSTPR